MNFFVYLHLLNFYDLNNNDFFCRCSSEVLWKIDFRAFKPKYMQAWSVYTDIDNCMVSVVFINASVFSASCQQSFHMSRAAKSIGTWELSSQNFFRVPRKFSAKFSENRTMHFLQFLQQQIFFVFLLWIKSSLKFF